ncbi:MAG: hypothetical protein LBG22_13255 [Treponema sp.]|jgi:hypothetical protein|nr:hypothetical protein [Treponema sp.]
MKNSPKNNPPKKKTKPHPPFLAVDGKERFKTHAEVLNDVFHQKTQEGKDFRLALGSVWPLDTGGYVCFFPLAEQTKGGWHAPHDTSWLNIPSPDERTLTQIRLPGAPEETPIPSGAHCAVFVRDGDKGYRFFGKFTRTEPSQGIARWKRRAAAIVWPDKPKP